MEKKPPSIVQEPGWEVVRMPLNIGSGRTLYSGLEDDNRMRLRVFRRKSDNATVGRVWFGDGAEGPPGNAHGGASAFVLDESMGSAAWMNHFPVVAAKLEFEYLHLTPLYVDLHIEARIEQTTAKRLEIVSTIKLPDGVVCVKGRGLFARLRKDKAKQIFPDPAHTFDDPTLKWADGKPY